jgi:uncharacterized protein CbrC (UPF0167 family)
MDLPFFKYHPDPIATGSIEKSNIVCRCCGQSRGYLYVGPVYSTEDLWDSICPWCIADGAAHKKFNAEFTDAAGIGDYSGEIAIPKSVIEEVAFRTPGFTGWQQEHWLTCCGDATAFIGRAGWGELTDQWPDAIPSIREDCGFEDEEDWQAYLQSLDKEGSATAYVFQCLKCRKHLGYSDCE